MRKVSGIVLLLLIAAATAAMFGPVQALADEIKMVGAITKIEISGPDATMASATLKDNKTGELVTVIVNDDLTLDKFKDHRIVEGDEIRLKYEVKDGKNISKYFRKTAGC